MVWHKRIGKFKVIEITLWNRLLSRWQTTILTLDCFYRTEGDHAPQVNFTLIVWNTVIFELDIYDTRHWGYTS